MEKIPTVKIIFKSLPDLILSKEEYDKMGGYKGFLKEYSVTPRDLHGVQHILMDAKDYPTKAWEG